MICIISSTNRVPSVSIQVATEYQKILKEKGEDSFILDLAQLPQDFAFSALYEFNGKNESFNSFIAPLLNNEVEHIVFIVPEYNGSFPGILKTFVDALSYPNPLKGKTIALTGVSSGPMGTALGLSHFTDVLNYLGVFVNPKKVRIPGIEQHFNPKDGFSSSFQKTIDHQLDELIKR
ncbi:MAG: NADPH-dependent FMN reductase [Cyclobacteriaceae bacterium]